MSDDPFAPISGSTGQKAAPPVEWIAIMPVPDTAPAPFPEHPKLRKPSYRWRYTDAAGALLGFACRFDRPNGEKEFRPLTYGRRGAAGEPEWRWESWPPKRPLYGLTELAQRPDASVVVTEGEKACDAARTLLPGVVVVTSPNGAKSAGKADWSPLRGRDVTIWPDADLAGASYADAAAAAIKPFAKSIQILEPLGGCIVTAARGSRQGKADRLVAVLRAPGRRVVCGRRARPR
jgi:putative DNA primase/helicase